MVMPVQSLMNMEMMLYGGYGMNTNAPSIYNNYRGRMYGDNAGINYGNYYNPYQYQGYNPTFGQSIMTQNPQSFGAVTAPQSGTPSFEALTQEDINKLADYYANNNALEEGFKGAATGGLSWMAFEHAQSLFHLRNAREGVKVAEDIFRTVPKEFMKENSTLIQEAYRAVQQAQRDTCSKYNWSGWLRKPIPEGDIKPLIEEMKSAVASGDKSAIAEATAKLDAARGFDGKLFIRKRTVAERLSKKVEDGSIAKEKAALVKIADGNFSNLLKHTFKRDFLGFMAFEAVFSMGKITTAFKKDTKTGVKQTGQSLGKAAAGTAGWCIGRAAGTAIGAKAGAAIGSAVCPGLGTLVGGLIGFTLGSIGMWAGHKLGNAIFGKDVADKVEAETLAQTQDGQVQLLQFAADKAKEGKLDPQTQQVLNKFLNAYA